MRSLNQSLNHKVVRMLKTCKKCLIVLIAVCITAMPCMAYTKDETVYGFLDADGNLYKTCVVNAFDASGTVTDYGVYTDVRSLVGNNPAAVDGEQITFTDIDARRFYYEGITHQPLPWDVEVDYSLDGMPIEAAELAGQSGRVGIMIDVKRGQGDAFFFDNYMLQIGLTLGDCCKYIVADGNIVTVGSNRNITITHMPGSEASYTVYADATHFAFDGVTATAVLVNLAAYASDIDFSGLINPVRDGMGDLIDGTTALRDGLRTMVGGLDELRGGADELRAGSAALADGSGRIHEGLTNLRKNGTTLLDGVTELYGGLSDSEGQLEQLTALCNLLQNSTDLLTKQLANATLQLIEGLKDASAGLGALYDGLQRYVNGVSALSIQYGGFNDGVTELSQGSQALGDGVKSVYDNVVGVPDSVTQLIEGQTALRDGVDRAVKGLESSVVGVMQPRSFMSTRNQVETVQFIIKTQPVELPTSPESVTIVSSHDNRSFWERLLALFGIIL